MANKKVVPPLKPPPAKKIPAGPFHFKERRFHLYFTLSVIAFCFLIYGNSISNGYSLDDEFVLHGDSVVQKGIKGIPRLFKNRYAWDQKGSYGYRPVVKASFAAEYQFFGVSASAGHVINLLIYALTAIVLFYFLRKILYNQVSDYFLLLVLALFVAHPIHSEVVDSLKNRDTMFSFLFGILCTYSFIRCFETDVKWKQALWIFSGCAAFNIGYLAKPDIVIFVAITPLVLFLLTPKKIFPAIASVIYLAAGSLVRIKIVNHILPHSNYHRTFLFFENPLLGSHWYQRIQLGFSSLWFYVSKLIFPKDLISYYGYDEFHPFPKWADIGVIMGIIVTGIMVWYIYKNLKEKGLVLFSLLLFAGTILVFINVIKVGPGIVAERFAFLPSVGFVLLVTIGLFNAFKVSLTAELDPKNNRNLIAIVSGVMLLYSVRVIVRNPDWKSHLSIYEHDAKLAPRSAKLQSLLAAAYIDEIKKNRGITSEQIGNYYQLAEKAFLASVDVYPQYATSLNNLGMIEYLYYKNYNTALDYFKKAIACDSMYTEAWFNAGSAYREMNNLPMAEKCYLKTIEVNPKYDMAYSFLSRMYLSQGKYDEVLKLNEDAIARGYATDGIYVNIGKVYLLNGDTATGISYFNKALGYFSKNEKLCEWLANYYTHKGDTAKAQLYLGMKEAAENYTQEAIKRQ